MKCEECKCEKKGRFSHFLLGAFVGGSLALLFTPHDGKENRRILKKKINELSDYIKNLDAKEVRDNIAEKIEELRKDLEALDKETVLRIAKVQSKKALEKANELYDYAVEKATPVVQNMTKEIKEKTVKVANYTIEKLEAEEQPEEVKKESKKTPKKSTK